MTEAMINAFAQPGGILELILSLAFGLWALVVAWGVKMFVSVMTEKAASISTEFAEIANRIENTRELLAKHKEANLDALRRLEIELVTLREQYLQSTSYKGNRITKIEGYLEKHDPAFRPYRNGH